MSLSTEWNEWSEASPQPWDVEPDEKVENQNKKHYDSAIDLYQEFSPAGVCLLMTRVAINVFRVSYLEVLFIGSTAFFATTVVRKIFHDYTLLSECERIALIITHRWPYLHVVVGVVAALFINDLPYVCVPLVAGVGALTALAFRVKWLSAVTTTNRDERLPF